MILTPTKFSRKFILLYISFIFILFSCSGQQKRNIARAFYFWKGEFQLSTNELSYLKSLDIKKLYLRFFDVDWNSNINAAVPVGDVEINLPSLKNIEIIPTIFITNRTLTNIPDSSISQLSKNIFNKISTKSALFKNIKLKEIQLDCDWNIPTKDKYFSLIKDLEKLAKQASIIISATIRLHQVKYFEKTGVPPVKKGMLMFYNMSNVSDYRTRNSIFDEEVAKRYLVNFDKYPLNLDVVLPAFSWGVHFRRDKIKGLINDLTQKQLLETGKFRKLDKTHFLCEKNFTDFGRSFYKNDMIRLEEITPETTLAAARMISEYLKNKNITIAIYHLNEGLIKNYETKDIQNIFSAFN